jgi:serine/threonine protein kinase
LIHKNFKSSNILLDTELNPHISDAGLASFVPDTEFQVKFKANLLQETFINGKETPCPYGISYKILCICTCKHEA